MSFEKYRKEVEKLINEGEVLQLAMHAETVEGFAQKNKLSEEVLKKLPDFRTQYQQWYSEALACITQLLPNRAADFCEYFRPAKERKSTRFQNYTMSDYLRGVRVTYGGDVIVDSSAALPAFQQQLSIVKSLLPRLVSSLFDIKNLVRADLFDNEIDAAEELLKNGYARAAGIMAGCVLESHLQGVILQRSLTLPKKATLAPLNDLLKDKGVVDVPTWRWIQHLIDIRNICGHKGADEPSKEQVKELIAGVRKTIKTIF